MIRSIRPCLPPSHWLAANAISFFTQALRLRLVTDRKQRAPDHLPSGGNQALEHLRKVNGITADEAGAIIDRALKDHRERSRHSWQIGIATHMVEKYPALANLKL